MFCKNCGKEVAATAVVCLGCGSAVAGSAHQEVSTGAIAGSYIAAFVIPLVGLIMGVYLLIKAKIGHGIGVLMLSVFSIYFWIGFWEGFNNALN